MTNEGRWLRGGGDPTQEPEIDDPQKLADLIGRHRDHATHVDGCDGRGVCCIGLDDRTAEANSCASGLSFAGRDYGGSRPVFGGGTIRYPRRRNP